MTINGSSATTSVHEVGHAGLDHAVDDLVGGLVDALLEAGDHAGREPLVDQPAVRGYAAAGPC